MVKNHRVVNIADHPAVVVNDRYVFAEMIQLGRFQHMFKMGVHHDQKRCLLYTSGCLLLRAGGGFPAFLRNSVRNGFLLLLFRIGGGLSLIHI